MKLQDGNCLIAPWLPGDTSIVSQNAIYLAWQKLHLDGLYETVFHENPTMPIASFMQFFSRQDVALQMCVDVTDENESRLAGMVWLSDIQDLPGLRRATGSFLWFKAYQSRQWTKQFADLALGYWFNDLKIDLLVGMTPAPNRAARLFSVSNGLEYRATLPNYTSFAGKPADAMIAMMSKDEYLARQEKSALMAEV